MAISFMCSLLESVLMTTPISFITMRKDEGDRNADVMMKMKNDPEKPLAAILSLNTIANTVGAAGVGHQCTEVFGNEWFGLISAIMTILILLFSEMLPKNIGTSHWKDLMWLSRVMKFLIVILYPIVWFIRLFNRLFRSDEADNSISREEVSAMANIGEEEGVLDDTENKVIQNLMKLDEVLAYDVMTPRVVAAIAPESMTLKQFYKKESLSHFSRIPVYGESPEFITGYVLRYDILEQLADDKFDTTLGSIRRDIAAFNESTSVSDIFENLIRLKDQMALIIDDYGAFVGIITLEDIIETILGMEIIDESDTVTDMQQYARERWEKRTTQYKPIVIPDDDDDDDAPKSSKDKEKDKDDD